MPSPQELELTALRTAQERLRRELADLDTRLNRLDQQLGETHRRTAAEHVAETRARTEPPPLPAFTTVPVPPPVAPVASIAPERSIDAAAATTPDTNPMRGKFAAPPRDARSAAPPDSLEFRLGTVWLVRIGVVILLTGLVFLGNFAYHTYVARFGAAGKLTLLYLCAGGLAALGAWLDRKRDQMHGYGKVLLAGGAATAYYATFAAHFVDRLQVIESPLVGGLALLAAAGGLIWLADRQKSELIALLAVGLAYYTSAINPLGPFTLFSCLLLTVTAVFFVVRHRWRRIPFAALVGSYGSYAFWRFVNEGGAHPESTRWGLPFLAGIWCIFTAAIFITDRSTFGSAGRVAYLTANNGAFFAGAAHIFAVERSDKFWLFALCYGSALLALSKLARRQDAEDEGLDGAYLAQGLAVLTLGVAAKLTEHSRSAAALTFAVESVILVTCSRWRHPLIYKIGGAICAVIAAPMAAAALALENRADAFAGILVLAVLFTNGLLLKRASGTSESRIDPWTQFFTLVMLAVIGSALVWRVHHAGWEANLIGATAVVCALALPRLRLPELAVGRAFLLVALGWWLFRRIGYEAVRWGEPLPWWEPLPLAMIIFGLCIWWRRTGHFDAPGPIVSKVCQTIGVGLVVVWGFEQVPELWRVAFFCALGTALVLAGGARRMAGAIRIGMVFALAGVIIFWLRELPGLIGPFSDVIPLLNDLLAMLAFAIAWRLGRKLAPDPSLIPESARWFFPALLAASIWLWVTRWSLDGQAVPVTVAWSLLALTLFFAGLGLRERAYRLAGLAVLALAIGRVFLFDVWRFETIGRILSFLVLGAVLLLLGYLYNRFAARFREWL